MEAITAPGAREQSKVEAVEIESTPVINGAIDVAPSTPRLPAVRMVPLARRRRK